MSLVFPVLLVVALSGCSDDYLLDLGPESIPGTGTWLIDESYVRWGCPGRDCIPNLTNPPLVERGSAELSYLDDEDMVVGVKKGDTLIAFPHPVLDWHEVANMSGYSISYCPLTGSAIHVVDDRGFGVSGLLYNSNLIMYDKESGSYWPQMFLKAAAGKFRGDDLPLERMIETTWKTWRSLYPGTRALSSKTGYSRNYQAYPYGSFKTDQSIYFPVRTRDSRLHPKERIMGIVAGAGAKAYVVGSMDSVSVIHDRVGNENYVIIGSAVDNFVVAYQTDRTFELSAYDLDNGRIVLKDQETGSEWNIFGEAVSGQLTGEKLGIGKSFVSFWFAWAAFYPETEIWSGE